MIFKKIFKVILTVLKLRNFSPKITFLKKEQWEAWSKGHTWGWRMTFPCWCLRGSSRGSSSFWPLPGYDHWHHVASTRCLRICGKVDYDLHEVSSRRDSVHTICSGPVPLSPAGDWGPLLSLSLSFKKYYLFIWLRWGFLVTLRVSDLCCGM